MARNKKKERKPNATYELPSKRTISYDKCVLSLDPGSRNFGIACVGIKGRKVRVLANALLTNPITSMVGDVKLEMQKFTDEIDQWMLLYRPSAIIVERFQTRGLLGPLAELVSMMLGILVQRYKRPVRFLTAATWKNDHGRRFGKENLKEFMYPSCLTQPHPLDATLIGIYGLEQGLGIQLNYTCESLIKQVENTSLMPLRKVKIKKEKK